MVILVTFTKLSLSSVSNDLANYTSRTENFTEIKDRDKMLIRCLIAVFILFEELSAISRINKSGATEVCLVGY